LLASLGCTALAITIALKVEREILIGVLGLYFLAGVLFVVGVVCAIWIVVRNWSQKDEASRTKEKNPNESAQGTKGT